MRALVVPATVLDEAGNQLGGFIPRLGGALLLLVIGIIVARVFARLLRRGLRMAGLDSAAERWGVADVLDRTATQWDLPVPVGPVAQGIVLAIFFITAAAQLTISTALLMVLVAILLAALALPFALAFGLGGRDVARSLSAGRYVRAAFDEGQVIRVDDVRGRVERIEPSATVLRTENETIRVPNHVLIQKTVVIEDDDGGDTAG
jgi:small-conductance mechanosensitive channel